MKQSFPSTDAKTFELELCKLKLKNECLRVVLEFRANIGIKRHGELSSDNFSLIKGERFTTFDNDQDTWKEGNCAADLRK